MKFKKVILVSIICYMVGLGFYSFDTVMQSFPSILTDQLMKTFSISSFGIGIIASAYFYSYNLMQIPSGIFCDKFGSKAIFLISATLCVMGLTLFAYSSSVTEAVIARILMGLGASSAAVVFVLVSKQYFDIKYLPVLLGIGQFSGNIGGICGQYPLSVMADFYGWRSAINTLNVILIILMIFAVIFMSGQTGKKEFFQAEKQKTSEVMRHVFGNKKNWLIAFYAMLLWTPFYTFSSLWGIPYLKESLNMTTVNASQLIAIAWIGSGIGSILIGVAATSLGKQKRCIAVSALLGAIIFPVLIMTKSHNIFFISTILFIFGCASAGQALSFALISDNNAESHLGIAVGFNNTAIILGPMLLDPIIGWLIKSGWSGQIANGIPFYSVDDYQRAFILIPMLFLAAFIISLFYREKDKKDTIADKNQCANKKVIFKNQLASQQI